MALCPWNVLAGGKFRTDAEEEQRKQTGEKGRILHGSDWERNETETKVSKALEKVAREVGAKNITSGMAFISSLFRARLPRCVKVAIAYLMQKTTFVFPIIGGRKVEHLVENIEALDISLSPAQMLCLEQAVPLDLGFPGTMIVSRAP